MNPDELHKQIQRLIDIAFNKGLADAIDEARKLNNPYIIDRFHDVLKDELHNALVERGKTKEE